MAEKTETNTPPANPAKTVHTPSIPTKTSRNDANKNFPGGKKG